MVKLSRLLLPVLAVLTLLTGAGCEATGGAKVDVFGSAPMASIEQVFNEVALPTYKIVASDGSGSGVAVDSTHVLTAAHVVITQMGVISDDIIVFSKIGKNKVVAKGKVVRMDRTQDLALLETEVTLPYTAQLVIPREIIEFVYWGAPVVASGYALGVDHPVVTTGVIADLDVDGFVQYTAPSVFGNSGGPVYVLTKHGFRFFSISQQIFMAYGPVTHMGLGASPWAVDKFLNGWGR